MSIGPISPHGFIAQSIAALPIGGVCTIPTSANGRSNTKAEIATRQLLKDTGRRLTPSADLSSMLVSSPAIGGIKPFLFGQMNEQAKPTTVANDESKRWRGGRGDAHKVEERAQVCYAYILEGGTRNQICARISERFGVSMRTAHEDYKRAMILLKQEQQGTREELLNQIQALRLATVTKALRKGQLQTVAMLLADMGKVIGESAPEQLAISAPDLKISIEPKADD